MSFCSGLKELPPDAILGLTQAFRDDPRPRKVNLGVGIFYGEDLKPVLPEAVRTAERKLLARELPKTYLPIDGDPEFLQATSELFFGETLPSGLYSVQSAGGTGGLRVAGELLAGPLGIDRIYLSDPTWANHPAVFKAVGLTVERYSYLGEGGIDFEGFFRDLEAMPEGSAILLHPCCHNPTGFDPTPEEWSEIADRIEKRKLLPLFDCAYHGLGSGFEEDSYAPRLFAERGIEFLLTYSYSKNMGLYNERVGALFVSLSEPAPLPALQSHVRVLIRRNYSNPPSHGARICATLLGDPLLRAEWKEQVGAMRRRLCDMRSALAATGDFAFLERQRGLFSLMGLTSAEVERLRDEYAIYMPASGRINVTGLNRANLPLVIEAISSVR